MISTAEDHHYETGSSRAICVVATTDMSQSRQPSTNIPHECTTDTSILDNATITTARNDDDNDDDDYDAVVIDTTVEGDNKDIEVDDEDDLSVTFSVVWNEIFVATVQQPCQQPSSTASVSLDQQQQPQPGVVTVCSGEHRLSRSSSFSSTDLPFQRLADANGGSGGGSSSSLVNCIVETRHHGQHRRHHQATTRAMMTEESRSLDSMNVMYHNSSRTRENQNSNHNSSEMAVPSTVTIGNTTTAPATVTIGNRTTVPAIVTISNTTTADGDDESVVSSVRLTRLQYFRRVIYWSIRLIFLPIWLLISVFTVSSVIAFCILPGFLITSIVISCYYCCSRDPIPFNVLVHALFVDDDNNNRNDSNSAPTRTKEEIRDLLICRTCTVVESVQKGRQVEGSFKLPYTHQPNHTEIIANRPLCIATESFSLKFSEPILHNNNKRNIQDPFDNNNNDYMVSDSEIQQALNFINTVVIGNDDRTNSFDAVHVISNDDDDDDDDEVIVDDDPHIYSSSDIEQGMNNGIEMTPIATTESINVYLDSISSPEDAAIAQHETKSGSTRNIDTVDQSSQRDSVEYASSEIDDEYESGIGCDICLRRYHVNDIVAWSNNDQCIHAYHLHCITDWLQKKISCPNCRCSYVPGQSNKRGRRSSNNVTSTGSNNSNRY